MTGNHAVFINDRRALRSHLTDIGVDAGSYEFLLPKGSFRYIKLKHIPCRAAHIIKQEMLSKGGEAAIGRQAMEAEGFASGHTDVLLMGTLKHFRQLVNKLQRQPFGLQRVAADIERIIANIEKECRSVSLPDGQKIELGRKTIIMGILNVTPDSFSDGGKYKNLQEALTRAEAMTAAGADIIDVGAVSSRPQAELADEQTELQRLLPVVEQLRQILPGNIYISIDTFRAKVAAACLARGAHIINDIGRLQLDKELGPVLRDFQAPVVLMHNRLQFNRGLGYADLMADIISELSQSVQEAIDLGIGEEKIIIDPGLGFGKTVQQNCAILNRLADLRSLGMPILAGVSRKDFIGQTLGLEVTDRLEGSLAAAAAAIINGAHIIRVHDVQASKRVALMLDAVKQYG